jgi:hypothetical protein
MLAKPLKIAGATALPTNSRKPQWWKDGGTASVKRTQGTGQAAGDFAVPSRLIQLRKRLDADADLVTLRGRQHQSTRNGERGADPSESSKIVAWSERSDK